MERKRSELSGWQPQGRHEKAAPGKGQPPKWLGPTEAFAQWTATRQRDPHCTGKGDGDVADTRARRPSRHWQLHKGRKLRREKLKTAKLARAEYGQYDAHRWKP